MMNSGRIVILWFLNMIECHLADASFVTTLLLSSRISTNFLLTGRLFADLSFSHNHITKFSRDCGKIKLLSSDFGRLWWALPVWYKAMWSRVKLRYLWGDQPRISSSYLQQGWCGTGGRICLVTCRWTSRSSFQGRSSSPGVVGIIK